MPLNNNISSQLLDYQRKHVEKLIKIIESNNAVLDASDTGTGKTYCSIAACAQLSKRPIIVCPKSVMYPWKVACKHFNVKPFFIANYESIK